MSQKDPRVDAYIEESAPFARRILKHIRRVVHKACPDVRETMKWSFPHFEYQGVLCSMASFKQHCAFGFWHQGMQQHLADDKSGEAMGHFGRIESLDDLPDERTITRLIRQAMELNKSGEKPRAPARPKQRKALEVPADLQAALRKNKQAKAAFDGFSYSHQKEYVDWITEAKRDETRRKRLDTTIEWLAVGKSRNWKYEK